MIYYIICSWISGLGPLSSILNRGRQKLDCFHNQVKCLGPFVIFISIQPLGQFWQEPEFSQATSMALVRCILGKFLGVVRHCFPLPLDVPTFAARCLHVPINVSVPSSETWNCEREWSGNFAEITPFLRHLGIFYMPQICNMGQTALLPFRRKACWGVFCLKNPTASAGSEPAILGTRGQHANH
jgi:hypothetical protein